MRDQVEQVCAEHADAWECPDCIVVYSSEFDEYGLPVRDGGESQIQIQFCPWCGTRLPESKRDAWFDAMERLGIDPWEGTIPVEYQTDTWWRQPAEPTVD